MRVALCSILLVLYPAVAYAGTINGSTGFTEADLPPGGAEPTISFTIAPNEVIIGPVVLVVIGGTTNSGLSFDVNWLLEGFDLGTTTFAPGAGIGYAPIALALVNPLDEPGLLSALQGDSQAFLTGTISEPGALISGTGFINATTAPVPEPGTFFLFGFGVLAAMRAAKKRRAALAVEPSAA